MPILSDDVLFLIFKIYLSLLPDRLHIEHMWNASGINRDTGWEAEGRAVILHVCQQWARVAMSNAGVLFPNPFISSFDVERIRQICLALPRVDLRIFAMELYPSLTKLLVDIIDQSHPPLHVQQLKLHGPPQQMYSIISALMRSHPREIVTLDTLSLVCDQTDREFMMLRSSYISSLAYSALHDYPSILKHVTSLTLVVGSQRDFTSLTSCAQILCLSYQVQRLTLGGDAFTMLALYALAAYHSVDVTNMNIAPALFTQHHFRRQYLLPDLQDLRIVYGALDHYSDPYGQDQSMWTYLLENYTNSDHPAGNLTKEQQIEEVWEAMPPRLDARQRYPNLNGLMCKMKDLLTVILHRYRTLRGRAVRNLIIFVDQEQEERVWIEVGDTVVEQDMYDPRCLYRLHGLPHGLTDNLVGKWISDMWELEVGDQ
jgi:hypothetical protein